LIQSIISTNCQRILKGQPQVLGVRFQFRTMVFAAGDDDGKPELQSQELEKKPQDQIYIEFPQGLKTFLTFLKK
jgi:hypothetical protein